MKKWRSKPFPIYDDMVFLVEGTIATGVGAFHAGVLPYSQSPSQTQSTTTSQSQDVSSTIAWSQTQIGTSQAIEWSQSQNLNAFRQFADADEYDQNHDGPSLHNSDPLRPPQPVDGVPRTP